MLSSPMALPEKINPTPKKKLRGFGLLLLVVLFIGIGGLVAIWHFGSQSAHIENKHPLYSSFDESPEYKKLLSQLLKSKLSILSGKKEEGLIQFVEHYANTLSRSNRPVFVEDYNKDHFEYYQIAREAKVQIDQLLGQQTPTGDWILQSQNGDLIPE
jgi:biotin-(acetyl-CoA carboxylase) ligase